MLKTQLLSGNEAIALAVRQAGCHVAAAYPGTPSTEIMETIAAKYSAHVNCEWSTNEKVAMEVAIGASIAGARAFCSMKHVGLNVAMDPLMTYTFIGTNGALVILVADDPNMHSSQNEQDTRILARFARVALFEPSNSQEAFDMTFQAFDLSEQYGTPVIVRSVTRLSHTSTPVAYEEEPKTVEKKPYVKNIQKTVAAPAFARLMRGTVEKRTAELLKAAETSVLNYVEPGTDNRFGFVSASVAYQHVKEVFPEFPVLKLGFTNPLPIEKIRAFAATVGHLVVVEELDPFMAEQIRAEDIKTVRFKTPLTMMELNPTRLLALRKELGLPDITGTSNIEHRTLNIEQPLPTRPPVLCAGCGHRGVFHMLGKLKATVMGDIGCYTLGAMPPLYAMDTTICMGASISSAIGMRKAGHPGRIAAVIGDSTFFHSGMTGLIDAVYNKAAITTVILDNTTTAMTGHQDHPGTGVHITGEDAPAADIEAVCKALGVKNVWTVSPYQLDTLEKTLAQALDAGETNVVIVRAPCVLAAKLNNDPKTCTVDESKCNGCGQCFKLGCPAILRGESIGTDGKRFKRSTVSTGCLGSTCTLCKQVCKLGAIG